MNDFKQEVEIEDADKCTLCQECTKYSREQGLPSTLVKIGENDSHFKFIVEGTGALAPGDIVERALKILQKKLTDVAEALNEPRYIMQ